jgi:hypothetical protein
MKCWVDEENEAHIHNGILVSCNKEGNSAICNNMDEDRHRKPTWPHSCKIWKSWFHRNTQWNGGYKILRWLGEIFNNG